jgi:hypothetical protein
MSKRNLEWTEEKYQRFIKEGRGKGEGADYKPWWNVQDFPSYGRISRLTGWKTNRVYHLFSDNETNFLYLMDWEDDVIDIREHYPLLDLNETIDNVEDLRLDKFTDKNTGVPYVITTTFLLTLKDTDGKHRYVARSIKGSSELQKAITIEKLEIERRYWRAKGIEWGITTEKEIPEMKAKNIEWIYSSLRGSQEYGISENDRDYFSKVIKDKMSMSSNVIREELERIDIEFNLENGTSLYILKYLIASKAIKVNMEEKIDLGKKVSEVVKSIDVFGGKNYGTAVNH